MVYVIRVCECERLHHGPINPHRKLVDSFRPDGAVAAADVVNTRFYIKYCRTAFDKSARSVVSAISLWTCAYIIMCAAAARVAYIGTCRRMYAICL